MRTLLLAVCALASLSLACSPATSESEGSTDAAARDARSAAQTGDDDGDEGTEVDTLPTSIGSDGGTESAQDSGEDATTYTEVDAGPPVIPSCFDEAKGVGRLSPTPKALSRKSCTHEQVKTIAEECKKGVTECRAAASLAGSCGTCALSDLDAEPAGAPSGPLFVRAGKVQTLSSACEAASGYDGDLRSDQTACVLSACSSCATGDRAACGYHAQLACAAQTPSVAQVTTDPHAYCDSERGVLDFYCGSGNGTDAFDFNPLFPTSVGGASSATVEWECSMSSLVGTLPQGSLCSTTPSAMVCKSWTQRGTCSGTLTRSSLFTGNLAIDAATCVDEIGATTKCVEPSAPSVPWDGKTCLSVPYGTYCDGNVPAGFSGADFAAKFNSIAGNLGDISLNYRDVLDTKNYGKLWYGMTVDTTPPPFFGGGLKSDCAATPDSPSAYGESVSRRVEFVDSFKILFQDRLSGGDKKIIAKGSKAEGSCSIVVRPN